jgi:hypothetical protein
MSLPVKETDHEGKGLSLLTGDNRKQNIKAIASVGLRQTQKIENAIFDVINSRILDNAVGVQLDLWGKIVGQPRGNYGDIAYRAAIRIKILVNISKGRTSDLLKIIQLCVPDAQAYYWDTGLAKYVVTVVGAESEEIIPLQVALSKADANGVGGDLIYSTSGTASTTASMLIADTVAGGFVPSKADTVVTSNQGLAFAIEDL